MSSGTPVDATISKNRILYKLETVVLEPPIKRRKINVTPESHHPVPKTISDDGASVSDHGSVLTTSSLTFRLQLSGSEADFKPFWTPDCTDIASSLWLSSETDTRESRFCLSNQVDSWFLTKTTTSRQSHHLPPTFTFSERHENAGKKRKRTSKEPSQKYVVRGLLNEMVSQVILQHGDEKELKKEKKKQKTSQTKQDKKNLKEQQRGQGLSERTKTFRIGCIDPADNEMILKFFGNMRKTYNLCVDSIDPSEYTLHNTWTSPQQIQFSKYKPLISEPPAELSYLLDTPSFTRNGAIMDFVTSLKSIRTKLLQGKVSQSVFQYRSKKKTQTLHLPKGAVKIRLYSDVKSERKHHQQEEPNMETTKLRQLNLDKHNDRFVLDIFSTYFKSPFHIYMRSKRLEELAKLADSNGKFAHDMKLTLNTNGHLYLNVMHMGKCRGEIKSPESGSVCAIDPGIRTFMNVYDPGGKMTEIGVGAINELFQIAHKIDDIISASSKTTNEEDSSWMHRLKMRKFGRIKHLVDDLHWRTARWLCSNYSTILIPKLYLKSKKHSAYVNRAAGFLSFCRFIDRLQLKAKDFGVNVVIVGEAFTTKTCGSCGHLENVGDSRKFECSRCGLSVGRDFNAARNILIKHVKENLVATPV